MDTGGYTALDFALHDSHVLNTNVFHAASRSCWNILHTLVQSLQRRAGDVRTIIIIIIIILCDRPRENQAYCAKNDF